MCVRLFLLVITDKIRDVAAAFSRVVIYEPRVFQLSHPILFQLRMEHVPPGDPVLKLVCGSQEPGDFLLVRRVAICVSDHEPNSRTQDKLDDDVRGAGRSPSQTRHCRASWVWLSLELLLHNSFFCIPHFDISSDIAGCSRSMSAHPSHRLPYCSQVSALSSSCTTRERQTEDNTVWRSEFLPF